MKRIPLDWSQVDLIIEDALREDIGSGDVTTNLLFPGGVKCKAIIIVKEEGVIAGLPIAEAVFRKLCKDILWSEKKKEGDIVKPGEDLVEIEGGTRAVLTGERVALNVLQRLSGIATLTSRFVKVVEGLPVKILDTRKTASGLRVLDKYAVSVGGGYNHRFGLYGAVLIKDNHIRLVGSVFQAVELVRERSGGNIKIEVETSTLDEVEEAISSGADFIMLDNMGTETILKAVRMIKGRAIVEASGGVNLENVRKIAETGVDFISIGALTHSPRALDIGLYVI